MTPGAVVAEYQDNQAVVFAVRKVTIDEENPHEFPIEAKFDDGDEQNWSFDQFNEEMEKGTLQLMD